VSRKRLGAVALEVGGGHIVEGKIDFQGEQIAQSKVELLLDLLFVRVQLVQGAIPPLELSRFDSDPWSLTPPTLLVVPPAGDPAAAFAVAQVGLFQPARETMLTAGGTESIGHQHEAAVGRGRRARTARSE
jgi:hypothetical protein